MAVAATQLPFIKPYKLLHHQRSQAKMFANEDVALSPKDFPFLSAGDVISVYNPEETHAPRLLLKLTKGSLREDFIQKDAISIEQSLASTFQLKPYTDVLVCRVDQSEVELDSLELTFRDQYLGRSEMWRLKMSLVNTGVYLGKKIEFCAATIRCQVHEMWCAGNKVGSGVVSAATKIVFRSSTSMVYVFLQMSSEMWEFDIYGDLYFEKAVNGFLAQLFAKWKKNGSNHEVTIVLFSRVYYDASSLESFPEPMRECLHMDYRGKYYEDFYRVAVQNEKYEDWGSTLIFLRHIFVQYQSSLLDFHRKKYPLIKVPKGSISSAAQGNFLEVLNMSLNVFEKHFLDRSFDRTGQLSVVITPGVGVFEVDRELANVTMQRIIDNGVGSDLVCIGEQPLHAVPLLKFHNKASQQSSADDYSMPHWINLSFYSTHRKVGYASYIPRIRLPTKALTSLNSDRLSIQEYNGSPILGHCQFLLSATKHLSEDSAWPNSIYDFDDYDDKIFKIPGSHSTLKKRVHSKKSPLSENDYSKVFLRQNSEPDMNQSTFSDPTGGYNNNNPSDRTSLVLPLPSSSCSSAITIPTGRKVKSRDNFYSSSFGALNIETRNRVSTNQKEKWFIDDLAMTRTSQTHLRSPESSYGGSPKDSNKATTPIHNKSKELRKPGRALINPFDPSNAVIKLTSNRRRWTHIFPKGPTGNLIQQHHFQSGLTKLEIVHEGETPPGGHINGPPVKTRSSAKSGTRQPGESNLGSKTLTLLWGATGEQEWTPALTTGVDWKSLTIPACLPLTTDYFPDDRSLQVDYLVSDYSLLPDDVNADYSQQRAVYRRPLNTKEVFVELVSQRLAQGFQLVIRNQAESSVPKIQSSTLMRGSNSSDAETFEEYLLSIGRIFHRIKLLGSTITVTRYRPRHPYPSINVFYHYRFGAPSNEDFERATAEFTTEKLENYNWNYLDHYVCTRGDPDFGLIENLKYWRFRMLILPIQQAFKKGNEDQNTGFGQNTIFKLEETAVIVQDFLKFIETCINRIRRPNNSFPKGTRGSSGGSQGSVSSTGGFRERVNSNKITERPRMRSGSKLIEKTPTRPETGSGRVSPLEGTLDLKSSTALSDPFIDLQSPLPVIDQSSHENVPQELKLKQTASRKEIVAAMKSLKTGFSLIKSTDLPPWTFVSYDAVIWLMNHMEGVDSEVEAVKVFNEMLNEGLILHASGDTRHSFVFGFYLYYIVITDLEGLDPLRPHGDCSSFHNEWMEVQVPYEYCFGKRPASYEVDITKESSMGSSSSDSREAIDRPKVQYKVVYVDVDVGKKSDRQEWGHVKYQSVYRPDEAFEVTLQWMQATGAIAADLVQGWSRKAQQCNLQLVPIPNDLFDNSDSLRGPIFIPLNTNALSNSSENSEGEAELWKPRILSFQHYILVQFGFMRCNLDRSWMDMKHHNRKKSRLLYVHCSGNIFVLIPSGGSSQQVGYLWSCNYMVSKRWRTSSTPVLGDESYIQSVLKEFKEFCHNQDNRLRQSWNDFPEDYDTRCCDYH